VGQALAGCPARDRLLTCVSELSANAIEHTESGAGGEFAVAVGWPRDGVAFVAVMDAGGPGEPAVGEMDDAAESGRGLALVAAYSSRWGYRDTARPDRVGRGDVASAGTGRRGRLPGPP
jgi:anti-sigma regulatory factor (Ser/Thr protein kinase)